MYDPVKQDQMTLEIPTMKYRCGVQEDTVISITLPGSMGLADNEGGAFTIAMGDIQAILKTLEVRFVPAALRNKM
jgi:hypothetical protein